LDYFLGQYAHIQVYLISWQFQKDNLNVSHRWGDLSKATRQRYPDEKYLLQAHVRTQRLGSRPAWYRVLYCTGQAYPCWWDPESHVYTPVSPAEEVEFCLSTLREITHRIADISKLSIFSTEIAYTPEGLFLVVDYVNDQIDLRLQSKAADGVPDAIVENITSGIARLAERNTPRV